MKSYHYPTPDSVLSEFRPLLSPLTSDHQLLLEELYRFLLDEVFCDPDHQVIQDPYSDEIDIKIDRQRYLTTLKVSRFTTRAS